MKNLLTSCFGLGRLPIAPGTWGSMPPTIIFALMLYLGISVLSTSIVMLVSAIVASVICVKFAPTVIAETGNNDPGQVVADEVAGQAITFLAIPVMTVAGISTVQICAIAIAGFLLFRFFDILKPWPIHKLEKLPSGWGILADDLLAGVYAAIALAICFKLWIAELCPLI